MVWVKIKKTPNDMAFWNLVSGFVINCPSCRKKSISYGTDEKGKKKHKTVYEPVSVRNSTFRSRGVSDHLLTTLLLQIKKPLEKNNTYSPLECAASVDATVKNILETSSLSDHYYDLIVFHRRSEMSDIEAIFYYIRNSFAHGSFEVIEATPERVYKFESSKGDTLAAQMRLKESTLIRYLELSLYTASQVKELQKTGKKRP